MRACMDSYHVWQDAFDTYQSLSEGLKLAWLVVPPAFVLAFTALLLRYRLARHRLNGRQESEASPSHPRRWPPEPIDVTIPDGLDIPKDPDPALLPQSTSPRLRLPDPQRE